MCKTSNFNFFLKLRIFTNFNTAFPVVEIVFDFEEFSKEVLRGHCLAFCYYLYLLIFRVKEARRAFLDDAVKSVLK
jgi:hypothetical protein